MRVTFFGSDAFSIRCLEGLMALHPQWQWRFLTSWPEGPFDRFCRERGLCQADNSDNIEGRLGIVASYGLLIKPKVIDSFEHLLNAHPSLLPRWRGAAPIQRAIMNGDPQTGVSIMSIGVKFDTGPIWAQAAIPLHGDEFTPALTLRLANLSANLLSQVINEQIPAGQRPSAQSESGASQAPRITRAEAEIRLEQQTAAQVYALYRAISHQETLWTRSLLPNRTVQLLEIVPVASTAVPEPVSVAGPYLHLRCADGSWIGCSRFRVEGKSHTFSGPVIRSMMIKSG